MAPGKEMNCDQTFGGARLCAPSTSRSALDHQIA